MYLAYLQLLVVVRGWTSVDIAAHQDFSNSTSTASLKMSLNQPHSPPDPPEDSARCQPEVGVPRNRPPGIVLIAPLVDRSSDYFLTPAASPAQYTIRPHYALSVSHPLKVPGYQFLGAPNARIPEPSPPVSHYHTTTRARNSGVVVATRTPHATRPDGLRPLTILDKYSVQTEPKATNILQVSLMGCQHHAASGPRPAGTFSGPNNVYPFLESYNGGGIATWGKRKGFATWGKRKGLETDMSGLELRAWWEAELTALDNHASTSLPDNHPRRAYAPDPLYTANSNDYIEESFGPSAPTLCDQEIRFVGSNVEAEDIGYNNALSNTTAVTTAIAMAQHLFGWLDTLRRSSNHAQVQYQRYRQTQFVVHPDFAQSTTPSSPHWKHLNGDEGLLSMNSSPSTFVLEPRSAQLDCHSSYQDPTPDARTAMAF